jgi:hypothetical protein
MVTILIVVASSPVRAGTEIRRSGLDHWLINDVRVQRELKLTEAQCDAVYDLRWRTSELYGDIIRDHMRRNEAYDYRKNAPAEARIQAEHSAALARILTREQFARYEQIRLQYLREEALLEPAVQRGHRRFGADRFPIVDCRAGLARVLALATISPFRA